MPPRAMVVTTIMAARVAGVTIFLGRRDNPVTGRRQIDLVNSLREFHMMATQFSRTANDFRRRNDFPGDSGGTVDKHPTRTARIGLAGARAPTVILAVPDTFPAVIVARPDTEQPQDHLLVVGTGLSDRKSWAVWRGVRWRGAASPGIRRARYRQREPFAAERDPFRRTASGYNPDPTGAIRPAASPKPDRQSDHVTAAGYVISLSDDSSENGNEKSKRPSPR